MMYREFKLKLSEHFREATHHNYSPSEDREVKFYDDNGTEYNITEMYVEDDIICIDLITASA